MSPRRATRGSGPRYPRPGITGQDRRQAHIDWLRLIEVSGPFLSVPVLAAEWPDLEPLDTGDRNRLRREHRQWQEDPVPNRGEWISYVLDDLLGWAGALHRDDLDRFALDVPEHETTLRPSFALIEPGTSTVSLLGLVSDGSPVARVSGSDWPATPADRLAQLCRHHGVELGLATDGRWWALVWAPAGGVTTVAVFDAIAWPESSERDVVRAFLSLLQRRRFFGVPADKRLPALLRESLNNQEEITDRLGVQVRQAVELLVAAFGRADAAARGRGRPGLSEVGAHEVYRGAVTVMMRIIFLLFAEETGLLPADNELYARAYSAGGLYAELEQRVADARGNEGELEHTLLAWHRLLALFTVVYRGVDHPDLDLIAHDGSLFDPDAHPWLEGREAGSAAPGAPLAVDDRTVLHMLRAVQTVTVGGELRTVSFRTLTVEQIGYVYEGLLSFEGFRAADVVVGLIGKDGREDEVPLTDLERLATAHPGPDDLAAQLAVTYKDSGIGSPRALAAKLAPLTGEEKDQAETRLYAVAQDRDLVRRLLPFYRFIRQDLRGDPVVILPGGLYVTESALRASTGTHYTPRFLAEEVAEGALEPLVYSPGPLQTADRSAWKLRKPEEILRLKIADIAMGSGAFLVAACRYLAGKLIEARLADGDPEAQKYQAQTPAETGLTLDSLADELVIRARREIIEHCLYGADINPMAVEMAKLSLWLVSMDPHRPFTFLDDRLVAGDSLLGITSVEQLEWMHLDPREGRKLHEDALLDFMSGVRTLLAEVASERLGLVGISGDDLPSLTKKRQILADVHAKTAELTCYADLISGAALAASRKRGWSRDPGLRDHLDDEAERAKENLWLTAAKTASEAATGGKVDAAERQARNWLATDQPGGAFDRTPLHWPLVFPEVFSEAHPKGPGFDAVIGNPPFLHGSLTRHAFGHAYREYMVSNVAGGFRKNADLVAFFVLRTHALINASGITGLIATSSLAQGDSRELSLDRLTAHSFDIWRAVSNERWPTKGAAIRYCVVWICRKELIAETADRLLDKVTVKRITSSLSELSRQFGQPKRLAENARQSFQGSKIEGRGFVVSEETAKSWIAADAANRDVVFPYLDGRDLNNDPAQKARRWVVNFKNLSLDDAQRYEIPYTHVLQSVKPERDNHIEKSCRESWWIYKRPTIDLYDLIHSLNDVIALARVSSTVMPAVVSSRQVFHEKIIVFTVADPAFLAWLSSSLHYWWAESHKTTHGAAGDTQYSNARCFETLPRPNFTAPMQLLGNRLRYFRSELMLARQAGLTATYNLVHDQRCTDADIVELREIHRAIDEAVVHAYGWDDLLAAGLDHGFHDTRQGPRYTIGAAVRQEILDRLLELNHERYAAEVKAGLHDKRTRKRAGQDPAGTTLF